MKGKLKDTCGPEFDTVDSRWRSFADVGDRVCGKHGELFVELKVRASYKEKDNRKLEPTMRYSASVNTLPSGYGVISSPRCNILVT